MLFEESIFLYESLKEPIRLRALKLIYDHQPVCSQDLERVLDKIQGHIARHLTFMRTRGVIQDEKIYNFRFYSISEKYIDALSAQFDLIKGLEEDEKTYQKLKSRGKLTLTAPIEKWGKR